MAYHRHERTMALALTWQRAESGTGSTEERSRHRENDTGFERGDRVRMSNRYLLALNLTGTRRDGLQGTVTAIALLNGNPARVTVEWDDGRLTGMLATNLAHAKSVRPLDLLKGRTGR